MSQMPPNPPAPPPPGGWPPPADGSPPAAGRPGPDLVTAPPKSGMSTGLKALIGAGAVAIVAVVGFLVLGGDDDVDPSSPVGTVRALYDAFERRDCEAMVGLMSEELWSDGGTATRNDTLAECESDAAEEEEFMMEGVDLDFALESESDDAAVVSMKASFMGDSYTTTIDLVREGGEWKVDSFADRPGGSDDAGSGDESPDDAGSEDPGS